MIENHITRKRVHMVGSIEGMLKNYTPRQFAKTFGDAFTDSDGRLIHPTEARKMLHERFAQGERLIPYGDCEGFDPVTGCPGHPMEDEVQA